MPASLGGNPYDPMPYRWPSIFACLSTATAQLRVFVDAGLHIIPCLNDFDDKKFKLGGTLYDISSRLYLAIGLMTLLNHYVY